MRITVTQVRKSPAKTLEAVASAIQSGEGIELTKRGEVVLRTRARRSASRADLARQCRLANEADKRDNVSDFGDWP